MLHPEESFNILLREIEYIKTHIEILKDLMSKRKLLRKYSFFIENLISGYSRLIALSIMKIFDKKSGNINSIKNSIKKIDDKKILSKYVTGLTYHHFNITLPGDCVMEHFLPPHKNLDKNIINIFNTPVKYHNIKHVFTYAFNRIPNTFEGFWFQVFLDKFFT